MFCCIVFIFMATLLKLSSAIWLYAVNDGISR